MSEKAAHARIKALFLAALDQPEDERAAWLRLESEGDSKLIAGVEALLSVHLDAQAFLASQGEATEEEIQHESPGDTIDRYQLLQQIGEGGFGDVWMAEQTEPVRRKVALKIIKLGMDSKQVIARFEAERQALAMMDHPNIAKVLDGGETPRGRPFFAMELVRGVPITEFCDEQHLNARERLDLFKQVCNAVHHAHQKGIIHRDIKPSNILVTLHDGVPVPKVIDFGIAKATHQPLTDKTLFTEFRQMMGTPEYMAPEQAEMSGLDVDTRADIYSLGVLLYELLTGTKPFEFKRALAGYLEVLRVLREEEPPKPSTRVSTLGDLSSDIAKRRHTEPSKLGKLLRGDLDWIILKALEKDRARRYESASAFAADVQRYLSDETVWASPPSRSYRIRKYVRRNKVGVAAAVMVCFALVVGTAGATWGFLDAIDKAELARIAEEDAEAQALAASEAKDLALAEKTAADKARQRAVDEASRARTMLELLEQLLTSANPYEGMGESFTVIQLLDNFQSELATRLASDAPVEASIRRLMGKAYMGLGQNQKAKPHLEAALSLRLEKLGEESALTAESLHDLGDLHTDQGDYDLAIELFDRARAALTAVDLDRSEQMVRLLTSQNWALWQHVKWPRAVTTAREAVVLAKELHPQDHDLTAKALDALSLSTRAVNSSESVATARESLAMRRRMYGKDDLRTSDSLTQLGFALLADLDPAEAEEQMKLALNLRRKHLPSPHSAISSLLNDVGLTHAAQGRHELAIELYEEAMAMNLELFGNEHPWVAVNLKNLAQARNTLGQFERAEEAALRSVEIRTSSLGEIHMKTAYSLTELGIAYRGQGRHEDSENCFLEALEIWDAVLSKEYHGGGVQEIKQQLAHTYMAQGKKDLAMEWHFLALEECMSAFENGKPFRTFGYGELRTLAGEAASNGDLDQAIKIYRRKLEIIEPAGFVALDHRVEILWNLGRMLGRRGDHAEAEKHLRLAFEGRQRSTGADDDITTWCGRDLAIALYWQGKHEESLAMLEGFLETQRQGNDISKSSLTSTMLWTGWNLIALERAEEAELLLNEWLQLRGAVNPDNPVDYYGRCALGAALAAQGRHEEAEPYLATGALQLPESKLWEIRRKRVLELVIAHYESWGRSEEAEQYRALLSRD